MWCVPAQKEESKRGGEMGGVGGKPSRDKEGTVWLTAVCYTTYRTAILSRRPRYLQTTHYRSPNGSRLPLNLGNLAF